MKKSTLLFSIFLIQRSVSELQPSNLNSIYRGVRDLNIKQTKWFSSAEGLATTISKRFRSMAEICLPPTRVRSYVTCLTLSLLTYSSVLLWAAWVLVVVSLCNVSWLPVDDVSIRWRRNRSTDNRHSAYRPHSSAAILLLIILKAFISFRKHPFQNDGTVRAANARMECHSYWEV